ncbi:MAG: DUF6261 family protein [Odoribacteraceae bacterium]|nr:DUF6261 family protein [Odoribacteraceae bacterium]
MVKSPIVRFNLHSLSNEVFANFFRNIIASIDKFGAVAIGVKEASDELKDAFEKVEDAINVVRKSIFTDRLDAQDNYRDKMSRGLGTIVRAIREEPETPNADDARALGILFEHYWDIPKRSYDAETVAIADLFRELDRPENVARLALFGLTALAERFRAANAKFGALMRQRYEQTSERPNINMRKARAGVKKKYDLLLYRLEALVALNGLDSAEELAGFVREHNIIATRYKHILAQEQGRRRAAREKNKDDVPREESPPEIPDDQQAIE